VKSEEEASTKDGMTKGTVVLATRYWLLTTTERMRGLIKVIACGYSSQFQ